MSRALINLPRQEDLYEKVAYQCTISELLVFQTSVLQQHKPKSNAGYRSVLDSTIRRDASGTNNWAETGCDETGIPMTREELLAASHQSRSIAFWVNRIKINRRDRLQRLTLLVERTKERTKLCRLSRSCRGELRDLREGADMVLWVKQIQH